MTSKLRGLIAATLTPFTSHGEIDLEAVQPMADHLIAQGISGFYVNGSTGEGPSLTHDERLKLAAAWVNAASGRVPVLLQIGHTSLREAAAFARHAQDIGVNIISACAPFYFPVSSEEALCNILAEMTTDTPDLPFYYYHIPRLTGARLDMLRVLELAHEQLPNLAGIKYSDESLYDLQSCQAAFDGHYDILWGVDEMLVPALAAGVRGAVGSTYNLAAPLYLKMMDAFASGNTERATELQLWSVELVRILNGFGGFHASLKALMAHRGLPGGPARLPLPPLSPDAETALITAFEAHPAAAFCP